MSAIDALRDAGHVLRVAPWLFLAGGVTAFVSTVQTASDSLLLSLVELLVGPYVAAGIVGVAFGVLGDGDQYGRFFGAASDNFLSVLGAQLAAGLLSLVVLLVPGAIAWGTLKPEILTYFEGGTPAFGGGDAVAVLFVLGVAFLVSLAFALVVPAVVDGRNALGGVSASPVFVARYPLASLGFGLVNAVLAVAAIGPGLYTFVAGVAGNPEAAASPGGSALLLLLVGGVFTSTVGPVYATAFYRHVRDGGTTATTAGDAAPA